MSSITSMSSRGQIVIPLDIREMMGLKDGEKFIISGQEDTIVLKKIRIPEFDALFKETRKAVKKAGITHKDVRDAIKRVREENSSRH
jgi:AbrB family looped-hinge helix DNA binding protein